MKKFFRLVSVFAIAGATFAYSGCTDYSDDIDKVNDRIDGLETGAIATLQSQVKSMQATITELQTAQAAADNSIKALQGTLSELQTKHDADIAALKTAYAAADAALKTTLEKKISDLKAAHDADVAAINSDIAGINAAAKLLTARVKAIEDIIPTLATKEYVDGTFATKEQMSAANAEIGLLKGRMDVCEKRLDAVESKAVKNAEDIAALTKKEAEDVAALQKQITDALGLIDKAQKAADAAQATASEALGKVDSLIEALGVYAEKGKLEATIAALDEEVDSLGDVTAKLDEIKLNISDFQKTFDAALTEAVKEDGIVGKEIASKISDAKKELYKKISDVQDALNERIDVALGVFTDRLTSIAFVPQYYVDGVPAILFSTIGYDPLKADDENDEAEYNEEVNDYKSFASALSTAKYRLNPKTVGKDCADFSFVGDHAEYIDNYERYQTRAVAPDSPVSIEGEPSYDAATGYVVFNVRKDEKLNVKDLDIVSLQAALKQGLTELEIADKTVPNVYSEYANVDDDLIPAVDVRVSDKALLAKKTTHEYAETFNAAKALNAGSVGFYEMPYNEVFDLGALVATCVAQMDDVHVALDLEKYGLHYNYSVASSKYFLTSEGTETDQQTVIECVDPAKGLYQTKTAAGVAFNKESIGRTPIVRIDLMHGDEIVTRGFVKLLISVRHAQDILTPYDGADANLVLSCPDTKHSFEISEETMRQAVYQVLNISHVEFWNTYEVASSSVQKDKVNPFSMSVPAIVDGVAADGKATKKVVWSFTDGEVGKIASNGTKLIATIVLKNKIGAASPFAGKVTFTFTVNYSLPVPVVTVDEKDVLWQGGVLQANVNVPASVHDAPENCWFNTPIEKQPWIELSVKGLPCNEVPAFRIVNLIENGKTIKYAGQAQGVRLSTYKDEVSIELDKENDDVKLALNSDGGLQAQIQWYAVAENGNEFVLHTFLVNFIRPLNLNLPNNLATRDAVTGGDLINFQHNGLLTDWRGELVTPETWTPNVITEYHWVQTSWPEPIYVQPYQVVDEPATFEATFEEVEIPVAGDPYYLASVDLYRYEKLVDWYDNYGTNGAVLKWTVDGRDLYQPFLTEHLAAIAKLAIPSEYNPQVIVAPSRDFNPATWTKAGTVTAIGRSELEAKSNLEAVVNERDEHYLDEYTSCGRTTGEFSVEYKLSQSSVTFSNLTGFTYTPATYKTEGDYFIYPEIEPMPVIDQWSDVDLYEGYTIGMWTWTKFTKTIGTPDFGQYWDFYGPIDYTVIDEMGDPSGETHSSYQGSVALDLTKVSTDLEDKKLPAGASLNAAGDNTVRYTNIQSPITFTYHIYIPASIGYGWGRTRATLILTVNPVGTIAK